MWEWRIFSSFSRTLRSHQSSKIEIVNGRYELMLFAWTNKFEKPDIQEKFSFTVNEDILRIFQQTVNNNDSFTPCAT
jgi:hypothetical protein